MPNYGWQYWFFPNVFPLLSLPKKIENGLCCQSPPNFVAWLFKNYNLNLSLKNGITNWRQTFCMWSLQSLLPDGQSPEEAHASAAWGKENQQLQPVRSPPETHFVACPPLPSVLQQEEGAPSFLRDSHAGMFLLSRVFLSTPLFPPPPSQAPPIPIQSPRLLGPPACSGNISARLVINREISSE